MRSVYSMCLVAGAALSSLAAGLVHAQEASEARSALIEEVVVTARKREESLQEVPLAVSAFSAEELINSGVDQFSDIAEFTPSLAISQQSYYGNATADIMVLRGQAGSGQQVSNTPAVGVYIDGVVNPHNTGMQASFFDMERIEVLKGPQGTLFGQNTTGGAINIITRKAGHDGVHGFLEADAGDYGTLNYRGAVNVPLIEDRAAVRLAYRKNNRDGFGESAVTGQKLGGDRNEDYFRGSLRLDFDTLRVMLVSDWLKERENGTLLVPLDAYVNPAEPSSFLTSTDATFVPASGCAPLDVFCGLAFLQRRALQGREDIYTNFSDLDHFDDTDAWSLGATLEWDISDSLSLKSITGYRSFEHTHLTNYSGADFKSIVTGDPNFPDREPHQEYELFTQEFNLSGVAFDGRLDWLSGAFYSDDEGADRDFVNLSQNLGPINGTPYFFTFSAPLYNQQSWALFSQATYALSERLNLTAGGRYTEEKKEMVTAHATLIDPDRNPATGANGPLGLLWTCGSPPLSLSPTATIAPIDQRLAVCSRPERSEEYDGWSWLLSLDWQASEDVLVYIKSAKGFRGGGFDIRAAVRPPFEPEEATDWEIGLKADWFDRRLRTNLAYYSTDYTNKQETVIIPGPSTLTQNAGEAEIEGFEAEVRIELLDRLSLFGTLAWFQGEYAEFIGARVENCTTNPATGMPWNPICQQPGFDQITYDAAGESLGNIAGSYPEWAYSIGGRWEAPVGAGDLGIQLTYSWRDDNTAPVRLTDHQVSQEVRDEIFGSVGLLNVRIDYDLPQWDLNLALWSTNLTDEEYQLIGVSPVNAGNVQTGITMEPRMWGATLSKRFGSG